MCKVLRLALPVLLAGVLALAVGTTPALAGCMDSVPFTQALLGGTLDEATCGTTPSSVFWMIGYGNPAVGVGYDNGAYTAQVFPIEGVGWYWAGDWASSDVDGCPIEIPQADVTLGPMATYINNGSGEGSSGHAGTYVVLSVDFEEAYQFYDLDLAAPFNVTCAPIPVPVVDSFADNLDGGFDVTLHWGEATNLFDDCATNPSIYAPDCDGGSRSLLTGWAVYSKEAECAVGPLTGDRNFWTFEANVPLDANLGTTLAIQGAVAGLCRFVAVNPVWESGMQGQYLSGHTSPIGGTGDQDEDGVPDYMDNCLTVVNPLQEDGDSDLIGDVCDNCVSMVNQDQIDGDLDGLGDVCDVCPTDPLNDVDGDNVCGGVDNCPAVSNADQSNLDGDAYGDACDVCPLDPMNDVDADGLCANVDNCPEVANVDQTETDGDGLGNACDPCIYEAFTAGQLTFDKDGDGICSCDAVLFNAGTCAGVAGLDNCPRVSNPDQTPSGWGDGLGSACEDNFGVAELMPSGKGTGLGDCLIRFNTLNEWNCPTFRVIYRGGSGDRDSGIPAFPCLVCTRGTGVTGVYYGGETGAYIKSCHGGHNIYVVAERAVNSSTCPDFVNPGTVVGFNVEMLATAPIR